MASFTELAFLGEARFDEEPGAWVPARMLASGS